MTEEVETGRTGPRIENEADFAKWLEEARPAPDVCVALSARAALRALPFILEDESNSHSDQALSTIASGLFRACATSWVAARYSSHEEGYGVDIVAAITSIIAKNSFINSKKSAQVWAAANAALTALRYKISMKSSKFDASKFYSNVLHAVEISTAGILLDVARRIGVSVSAEGTQTDNKNSFLVFNKFNRAEDHIWYTIEKDVYLIYSEVSADRITASKLWYEETPVFVSKRWGSFKDYLPDSDNWWVWKNWYEDILNGRAHSEAHDVIYATVPEEEWEKGPAAANAWIAAELAKLEKNTPDSFTDAFEKLTLQDPHGASFEIVEGKARIAESLNENDAKVAGDPQTIQLHERVKIRANNARERVRRLANQPGFESIAATVEEYYNYISDDTLSVAANISTVWELSVAIGSFIERDDEIRAGRGGMVSEMEPDARESLDQLVIASAPFVRRFPTARQNDEDVRLFKQSRTSFDSAKRIFKHAANENLIEDKSNLTINIAINAAEISSGIQSEKSVSWINSTARNFIAVLILFIAPGLWAVKISGEEFIKKFTDDIYDNSITTKKILNFARKRENDFYGAYSDSPPDLKAAHKEIMQELKKSLQSEKHHRK